MEAEEGGGEEYGSRKSTRDKKQSDVTTSLLTKNENLP